MVDNERMTEERLLRFVASGDHTPKEAAKLLAPCFISEGPARDKMIHYSENVFSGFRLVFKAGRHIDRGYLVSCIRKLKKLWDRE